MRYRIIATNDDTHDHEVIIADSMREAFKVADALEAYYPDRHVVVSEVEL